MKKENSLYLKIKKYFIYILPIILFFSYYPLFLLDSNSDTNYELSLPLIWIFLFSIISIPSAISFLKKNFSTKKRQIIVSVLFPLYSTITIIWSLNPLRAVLTSGILWCLWLSIISIVDYYQKAKNRENEKTKLLRIFFISTIIICIFCWLQCAFDVMNISREGTLLCPGCTNHSFGFPHPSGFAIEPQFMGNLLLVPTFLSLYLFLGTKEKHKKILLSLTTLFSSSTLFLTMSRGAIYAFIVGLVLFFILEIKKQKTFSSFKIVPILIASFLFTLCFQGLFAEISPTNDTFTSGVSKVVNQMSLGIIDIPYNLRTTEEENDSDENNSSQFDGYAEVSTTTRLDFSKLALKTWLSSPTKFIFGTGTGSAGKAMYEFSPEASGGEKEIVQNETLEIALELGLIGIVILIVSFVELTVVVLKIKHRNLIFPIIVAFFISYQFFSGLPNALHIFLLPALIISNLKKNN